LLQFYPDVAIFVCDGRQHLNQIYETVVRGAYLGGKSSKNSDAEKWAFFNVFDFQYPSDIEVGKLKAIIIPDSATSSTEINSLPWITNLVEFTKKVYLKNKSVKLLGIGFGAQIIA